MNTLIHKLADQAHKESYVVYLQLQEAEGPANVIFYDIFNEKFAELIVRECIRLCDQVDLAGADDCIDNIKDYFEIKK